MQHSNSSPPKFFVWLFQWFCAPELWRFIEGDLIELFYERVEEKGLRKARRRFAWDVLLLFRPGIIRPIGAFQSSINYSMFRNYFKVGFRNIIKYKAFSFINIFGLAVSMSVCMLIILMLVNQKQYDKFHEKKDRIYRVIAEDNDFPIPSGTTPFPLASTLEDNYPAVEKTTRITRRVGGDVTYDQKILSMRGFFADPAFFEVFSFDLNQGNKSNSLKAPNSMVITADMAKRLFGSNEWQNSVGKTVKFTDRGLLHLDISGINSLPFEWGDYIITGVFDEKEYKSHLKFDVLVSASTRDRLVQDSTLNLDDLTDDWDNSSMAYTYLLLNEGKNKSDLNLALAEITEQEFGDPDHSRYGSSFSAQKLSEITPGRLVGNPTTFRMPIEGYYILGLLALVIMLSACLNYANLSIARSLTRAKEIGVRKVGGATRKDLVFQFLSESVLTALVAMGLAIVFLMGVKPAFTSLWINNFMNFDVESLWFVYLIFFAFAILIGLIAGSYPAFHMSKFLPIQALKTNENSQSGKLKLRKVLSITQFVVSIFFITSSILIYNQFKHFLDFKYGFVMENIVNIELQSNDYEVVAEEMRSISGVTSVSACSYIPATGISNTTNLRKPGATDEDSKVHFIRLETDHHFAENLGLEIIAGRNFDLAGETSNMNMIVNETGAKELGFDNPLEIIGQSIERKGANQNYSIIGVVEDFRVSMPMMQDKIGALMIRNRPDEFRYLNVKINSDDQMAMVKKLESKWESIDPIHDFKYRFLDDQIASANLGFKDIVSVLGFITFLAIVISCLGLLGMATYTAERRTKEVGIRKVLGADSLNIAMLLSKEFLKLLAISVIIAAPLSYFVNNLWLQNLPNRVDFGFGTVFLGAASLLLLGLIVIGSQTYRVAKGDPVDSLRMD